jgi:hypothetical protein
MTFSRRPAAPGESQKDFVWLETPYVYRATVLKTLEKDGRLASVVGRGRGGGYGDSCLLRFKP